MDSEKKREEKSETAAKQPSLVGVQLGRFRVERLLGAGGMGGVWLAVDPNLNRRVALKVMAPRLAEDDEFVARFRREAQSAAAVSHPNLVAIHELSDPGPYQYFVMEYVEGETLADRIERFGPLPPAEALHLARQACLGLAAAWRMHLVHRDIKPGNILLGRDGSIKLTDFGLAKALEDSRALTRSDVIVGTPQYVSPEQARGERTVDHRSDMYSLGVTLYHALSGRLPFEATTPMAVMLRHVNDPPPPLDQSCPGLPPPVFALVHRLLEKDPARRFATYEELLVALEAAQATVPAGLPAALRQALPAGVPTLQTSRPNLSAGPATLPSTPSGTPQVVVVEGQRFPPFGGYSAAAFEVFWRPTQAFERLAAAPPALGPTAKYGAWMLGLGLVVAGLAWPGILPGFVVRFFVLSLLLDGAVLVLLAPADPRQGRVQRAFTVVALTWVGQLWLLGKGLALVALLRYPFVAWRAARLFLGMGRARAVLAVALLLLSGFARVVQFNVAAVGLAAPQPPAQAAPAEAVAPPSPR